MFLPVTPLSRGRQVETSQHSGGADLWAVTVALRTVHCARKAGGLPPQQSRSNLEAEGETSNDHCLGEENTRKGFWEMRNEMECKCILHII